MRSGTRRTATTDGPARGRPGAWSGRPVVRPAAAGRPALRHNRVRAGLAWQAGDGQGGSGQATAVQSDSRLTTPKGAYCDIAMVWSGTSAGGPGADGGDQGQRDLA